MNWLKQTELEFKKPEGACGTQLDPSKGSYISISSRWSGLPSKLQASLGYSTISERERSLPLLKAENQTIKWTLVNSKRRLWVGKSLT